ncbi:glycosyltransferase [Peteryoungia ipomoeae]|uniref:Glycosyltransferase family 4 protein n=1 Tax=Peteryoungia ipomoeae TaxID=1210932 RepID=A0A4S8P5Q1_9HYPH|nr:glycosyltransferase [Peteryoungia ipomoeae]THV23069.1 glycosyltransferase family 4 protein [Peteryoungia ipomoeae]
MPVKTYGIYLAYGPRVDLRSEGLGRHLAEFLAASTDFTDVKFVIAAPKWMRAPLHDLFESFDLDPEAFEIISPPRSSLIGIFYKAAISLTERRKKPRTRIAGKGRLKRLVTNIKASTKSLVIKLAKSRNPLAFVLTLASLAVAIPIAVFLGGALIAVGFSVRLFRRLRLGARLGAAKKRLNRDGYVARATHTLYRLMCDIEAESVSQAANKYRHVKAWYAPAAFWPEFNQIKAPRLMCVPDAVPIHFSVAFATEEPSPDRRLQDFRRIQDAIEGGDKFVTYSQDVKERTLVHHFHVDPSRVTVVRHGANRLEHLIKVSGFVDNEEATDILSAMHLWTALAKAVNNTKAVWYTSRDTGFLFYASQIRPNKNVMTLLKAYHFLRRTKNLPYKLLMTGEWRESADVKSFMDEMNLHEDVLFVRGLSEKELAACYRLATLAVNPSLAEGGMPFTFTESLSVGTPVVMADIAVSREIIDDAAVADRTFFDGFDYKDVARVIREALDDVDGLRALQREFYDSKLSSRSWRQVVGEYIDALESCASSAGAK